MAKHRQILYSTPLPQDWLDAIQEYISTIDANFIVSMPNATTVQVVAGTGSDQVSIGIGGLWRYISATINAAHPGGVAGLYDVYVVASANSFTAGGGNETDNTDYTFGLRILPLATPPTGNHNARPISTYRRVGQVTWDGTAITMYVSLIRQQPPADGAAAVPSLRTLGTGAAQATAGNDSRLTNARTPTAHASTHAPAGSDALPWLTIHGYGTAGTRPAAAAATAGYVYYATDTGALSRSNGATYDAMLALPIGHQASHVAGGGDALPWTTIHGAGLASALPAATAANAGYLYFATDTSYLYRSTGSAWAIVGVAPSLAGTFAARPAASAHPAGILYLATDIAGGTLYRTDGAAWSQVSAGVTHAANHLGGGSDAISWLTVHNAGLFGSRPTAVAANTGYFYLATDVNSGTLYLNYNGSSWTKVALGATEVASASTSAQAILLTGTIAARPAAAAGNTAFYYYANDVVGGVLYQSSGSAWSPIARSPWYRGADLAITSNTISVAGSAHRISGGGTISLIANPANLPGGFELTLIFAATTTLTSGGNIYPNANGTPIVFEGNDACKLVWDDLGNVWHVVHAMSPQRLASTITLYGTVGTRPAAAAANAGFTFYATDTSTIYRSNGTTWDSLSASALVMASQILLAGTSGTRPAASGANTNFRYFATDTGIEYYSTGAAWVQVDHAVNIATGEITSAMIADGTIVDGDLAADTLTARVIAADSIGQSELAPNAVGSAEIIDGSIVDGDLAADTLTARVIAADSIGQSELAPNSVGSAEIIDGNVGNAELATDAVTQIKMADNSVGAAEIIDGSVGNAELATDAVTQVKMADNSVGAAEIIDGSVGTAELANDAVSAAKLAPGNGGGDDVGGAFPTTGLFNGYRYVIFMSASMGNFDNYELRDNVAFDCVYRADIDATYPWQVIGAQAFQGKYGMVSSTGGFNLWGYIYAPRNGLYVPAVDGTGSSSGGGGTGWAILASVVGAYDFQETLGYNIFGGYFRQGYVRAMGGGVHYCQVGLSAAGGNSITYNGTFTLRPVRLI